MANFSAAERTNYFRVKDIDALEADIHELGIFVDVVKRGDHIAIFPYDGDCGWLFPTSLYDEESREDEEFDFAELIARHIVPGDVAVIQGAGHEKLRYVSGWAVAVNSAGEIRTINLDEIYAIARELGPNCTEASY